ncbi:MAG: hypothetical protein MUC76_11835 [Spirochaetes bacterium]|jgi:hypothetical protein|nr:hypothetical protein [Spirochaetota bacterium]
METLDVRQVWNGIEIRLRWFARVYVFLLAVETASIVALFVFGIYAMAGKQFVIMISDFGSFTDALKANRNEPIVTIFVALATLVLLLGIYYSLARVLNSTVIRATAEDIRVVHGPVPWAKGSVVPRGAFERFEVQERAQRTKGGTTYYYRLMAKRGDDAYRLTVYLQDDTLVRAVKDELDRFYSYGESKSANP